MSKDSNEERDDEIIVSFAKTPPPPAEGADAEVVARISSERVVAAAEPMEPMPLRRRASAGEEQSRSSSSVAPKSVLVLIGGRCAFSLHRPDTNSYQFVSGNPAGSGEGDGRKMFSLVSAERVQDWAEATGHRLRFLFAAYFHNTYYFSRNLLCIC